MTMIPRNIANTRKVVTGQMAVVKNATAVVDWSRKVSTGRLIHKKNILTVVRHMAVAASGKAKEAISSLDAMG